MAIATRGSFTSEQAGHATAVLHTCYPRFEPPEGLTVLFEIVYPGNRIIVDYCDTDDLVLLGAVDTATGDYVALHRLVTGLRWTWPRSGRAGVPGFGPAPQTGSVTVIQLGW